jgi:hypothetical protein
MFSFRLVICNQSCFYGSTLSITFPHHGTNTDFLLSQIFRLANSAKMRKLVNELICSIERILIEIAGKLVDGTHNWIWTLKEARNSGKLLILQIIQIFLASFFSPFKDEKRKEK